MSEPTKEQIEEMYAALQIAVGEDWVVRPGAKDYMLTPAEILRLIAHVRKQARDDALETVRKCERRSGVCVMVHSILNPAHPDLCNEENCSSFRALKDKPDGEA